MLLRRQEKHRLTLALALLCSCGAVHSQTSANLTLLSSYTGRGIVLNPDPTLQLRVARDTADGWYAGGFVSPVRLDGRRQAQLTAYGGRARQVTSTLTLDAGVSHSTYSGDERLRYSEAYAGLMAGRYSARLFYSPHYYGEGRTVYLDLNTAYPLGDRLSLAFHAGLLHLFDKHEDEERRSGDLRVSLSTEVGDYRLQAGWQARWHPYLLGTTSTRTRALTVGASRYF